MSSDNPKCLLRDKTTPGLFPSLCLYFGWTKQSVLLSLRLKILCFHNTHSLVMVFQRRVGVGCFIYDCVEQEASFRYGGVSVFSSKTEPLGCVCLQQDLTHVIQGGVSPHPQGRLETRADLQSKSKGSLLQNSLLLRGGQSFFS